MKVSHAISNPLFMNYREVIKEGRFPSKLFSTNVARMIFQFQVYNIIVNVQFAWVEVRVCANDTQELPQSLVLRGSAVFPQLPPSRAGIITNIALELGYVRLWVLLNCPMSCLMHQKSSLCG